MLAYPTEDNKGKFIAIFWSIFNLGGVVGAAVSLGQNYDSSVSLTKYPVGYLSVECLGFFREIRVRVLILLLSEVGQFTDHPAFMAGRSFSHTRDLRK